MTQVAQIERKAATMFAAQRRVKRASRLAHVETQSLKYAVLLESGAPYIRCAIERAVTAQNNAILAMDLLKIARSELGAEWRNNGR
ncbi:hypothetical protein B5K08_21830 [Rhizobium leguminosarum bv. trifolii]|uniref:Uncharacterized protein n=1 Tax=Rhizobium leguminosarum bv. trifolii TaxID=386 RepID=A0A3E1B9A6_RHILT|nr:hypothetical protein [Rhizobium leguminosarum]RFB87921.1 hypothetical protein B5K08_21830 [Rhizobium leguminosarum bv. trifolii]RFB88162.1 hypothetical protein B5K10_21825 [Rhizobium leguminosarum bv. trifolii]